MDSNLENLSAKGVSDTFFLQGTHARGQLQRSSGIADGSGTVLVPQVEAFEKETADLNFTDTYLTFGIFSSVGVVGAVSLRAECGSDCGGSQVGMQILHFS